MVKMIGVISMKVKQKRMNQEQKQSRIVFLDIDGVLNSFGDMHTGLWIQAMDHTNWKPECIQQLNRLCRETKSKIVISSSWRTIIPDIKTWNEEFLACGVEHIEVIGKTDRSHNGFRGREINDYLKLNPCLHYVILDDESDFYPDQPRVHI